VTGADARSVRIAISSKPNGSIRIGGHLSISRGLAALARNAVASGCEAVQLFSRSPRGGPAKALDPADVQAMQQTLQGAGIGPLIVHCPYYVSPAHDRPDLGELATEIIADDLGRAAILGASYIVVHAGHSKRGDAASAASAVALRVATAVERHLSSDGVSADPARAPLVLIENGVGGRGDAAGTLEAWAACVHGVLARGFPAGGCLDTAHMWGAGWDLSADSVDVLLERLAALDILDKLKVIHFNDSSADPGSRRDRHEHIGQGQIPLEVFRRLLRDSRLSGRVGIVETDPADNGIARDVSALSKLRDGGDADDPGGGEVPRATT